MTLHPLVKGRIQHVRRVRIRTQESALRIIDKRGPLKNPADRDHCIQYVVAVALIHGELRAEHYEDAAASDPRIDALRSKMELEEDAGFSADYLDAGRRSIGNAVQVFFDDGTATGEVVVEYPVGHPCRRAEAVPLLMEKFRQNLRSAFPAERVERTVALFQDRARLHALTVPQLIELFL